MQARRLLAALALATVLVVPVLAPATTGAAVEAEHSKYDAKVKSFDDTEIAITVFKPANASADAPVPIVVRSHGWSGSRDKQITGLVADLLDAGYGVVTFDARGHGESGGYARVHDPDYEIRDVSVLYDWMFDHLDWAMREPGAPEEAKDLVMGGSGGSYGGGWQLLSAALDGRIDALVPEITWSSLPQALAPNEAVNSGWVHLLYMGGKARARLHPDIDRWYAQVMATNLVPDDARAHFEKSSVYPYAHLIDQPTLLVQGVPDTLFNLNHAVANYEAIAANGAPVKIFTHRGGHLLTAVFIDDRFPDVGFPQPGDKGSPCGDVDAVTVAWFDEHLRGIPPAVPLANVELAMDDLSCLRLDALPSADATFAYDLPVALPAGVASVTLPIFTAEGPAQVAGMPRLAVERATVAGVDDILYASLVVVRADGTARTVSSQVTPLRLAGPAAHAVDLEMGGVGGVVGTGETLFLRLDRVNEFYATNSGRTPSAVVLEGLSVELPLVSG